MVPLVGGADVRLERPWMRRLRADFNGLAVGCTTLFGVGLPSFGLAIMHMISARSGYDDTERCRNLRSQAEDASALQSSP